MMLDSLPASWGDRRGWGGELESGVTGAGR